MHDLKRQRTSKYVSRDKHIYHHTLIAHTCIHLYIPLSSAFLDGSTAGAGLVAAGAAERLSLLAGAVALADVEVDVVDVVVSGLSAMSYKVFSVKAHISSQCT